MELSDPGSAPALPIPEAAEHPAPRRSLRVLVADDDAGIRELLRDVLAAEGYEVAEAANGAEAVAQARSNPPAAVLMDLMMPILSGAEATVALKGDPRTSGILVVAMSAGRHLQTLLHGIPVDGFISKPFDLPALVSVLALHARA